MRGRGPRGSLDSDDRPRPHHRARRLSERAPDRPKAGADRGVRGVGAVLATQLPGLQEIGHQLAGADGGWIAAALILEIASTACFAFAFHGVYDRRTSPRASTSMSMAMQGLNIVLPSGGAGGLAVGAVLLDRAGVPRSFAASRTIALFLVTSLVSFVAVVIAGFGVAAGALSGEASLTLTLLPATIAARGRRRRVRVGALAGPGHGRPRRPLRRRAREHAQVPARRARRERRAAPLRRPAGDRRRDRILRLRRRRDGRRLPRGRAAGLPIGLLVLAYTLGHGGAIVPIPGAPRAA